MPAKMQNTVRQHALVAFNAECIELMARYDRLTTLLENSFDLNLSDGQVAKVYEAPPPSPTHTPHASDVPTSPDYQTMKQPATADPWMTAEGQPFNEPSFRNDDPFPDFSYPMDPTPNTMNPEPAHEDGMGKGKKKDTKTKKTKKTKRDVEYDEAIRVDTWPSFSGGPHVPYFETEHATKDGTMAQPGGGRLELPCIACLKHRWIVRFESPTIPSKVILGGHKKAMGFTICPTDCGVVSANTLTTKGSVPYQCTMIPLHRTMAENARKLLRMDLPIITWGNQVLFFQQSQISDMTKAGGTVTSLKCDVEVLET